MANRIGRKDKKNKYNKNYNWWYNRLQVDPNNLFFSKLSPKSDNWTTGKISLMDIDSNSQILRVCSYRVRIHFRFTIHKHVYAHNTNIVKSTYAFFSSSFFCLKMLVPHMLFKNIWNGLQNRLQKKKKKSKDVHIFTSLSLGSCFHFNKSKGSYI